MIRHRVASLPDRGQFASVGNPSRRRLLLTGAATGATLSFLSAAGEADAAGGSGAPRGERKVEERAAVDYFPAFSVDDVKASGTDCGHFLQEERPDELLTELRQFLN